DSVFTIAHVGYSHLVLVKTNPNGNFLWKLPFDTFTSANMVMDDSDNIYLDTHGITKIDSSGNIVWQNNAVIPPDSDYIYPIRGKVAVIDKYKNLYTLGETTARSTANEHICLAKFDSLGNFLWNAVYNSLTGRDFPGKLAIDKYGNIYVSGMGGYTTNVSP